ncbi:MAG TPA: DMT family transporter [Edaphocola sp.]|nr:DMT family transporter [Edaphocola sp.]
MKKSLLQMHIAVLLWGFTGVLGKVISLSAPVLVWYRMGLTALFIAIIIHYRKLWQKILKPDLKKLILIGLLFSIHWVMFYSAIKLANASIALICLSTSSVFTAVIEPLSTGKRINPREIGLSLIAIFGVYLIYALKDEHTIGQMVNFPLGLLLGLIASVLSAVFTVLNKPLTRKYEPRLLVFYEMMIGFIFLTIVAPFYISNNPGEPLLMQGWDIVWILCLVYFCTVLGQILAMNALKNLSSFTVTFMVNLEPLYGILLAFLLLNEHKEANLGFYLGVSVIGFSVLLQSFIIVRQSKKNKKLIAAKAKLTEG